MLRQMLTAGVMVMGIAVSGCTPPEVAQREQTIELTGVVRAIDKADRRVVIEGPERTIQFRVSEEAQNFEQVEVGDRVTLDYFQSVAVTMADPEDSGEALTSALGVRTAPGAMPGAAGASITSLVVELVSYDRQDAIAVIRTPEGEQMSLPVAREMRSFAAARQPGDRILVVIEEAVAVGVTPVA
jgi:hypothetical protein